MCCAKEVRAYIVLDWLNECNFSCKIVNCKIIVLNMAKENSVRGLYDKKKNSASWYCLPQTWCIKSIFKTLVYTPPDLSPRFTCIKSKLVKHKNLAWFLILASLFDRGMQRVNFWLPLRQRAKQVVSNSLGLVDIAIGLVNSVFNLPDGRVMFFEEFE